MSGGFSFIISLIFFCSTAKFTTIEATNRLGAEGLSSMLYKLEPDDESDDFKGFGEIAIPETATDNEQTMKDNDQSTILGGGDNFGAAGGLNLDLSVMPVLTGPPSAEVAINGSTSKPTWIMKIPKKMKNPSPNNDSNSSLSSNNNNNNNDNNYNSNINNNNDKV